MRTAFCHPGHFEPAAALRMIERERCAVLYVMFDTIWVPLIDHPDLADTDLSAVRAVYLVGPPDRMHAFQQRTPKIQVVSAFGMTEVCAHLAVAGPAADAETRLTTAGHIQPEMETRIIDPETGCDAPAAVAGELLFRGPFMFEGYYKQPEATAAAIDADGWFHSGDLGVIDAEGRSPSAAVSMTCSRSGVRTSLRSRSRDTSPDIRRSRSPRWSRRPMRTTPRSRPRSCSCGPVTR